MTGFSWPPGLHVSRETHLRLEHYVELLTKWQTVQDLVAPSTLETVWERHILDSAQLWLYRSDTRCWADLGSGAGFPGIVIGCLFKETQGGWVHLVESRERKCAFLLEVVRQLDLPVTVHQGRVEEVLSGLVGIDTVCSRALAPLSDLLGYSLPVLKNGAQGLFLKGRGVEKELTFAREQWTFTSHLFPSLSDSEGCVVRVSNLGVGEKQ